MVNITLLSVEREKLLFSTKLLQQAMEMGNMAWWEWDVASGLINMHERKATMLGYTFDEFPKLMYDICKLIHPEDYERVMQAMRDHLTGKSKLYDVVYRIKEKKGSYKWYYDKGGIVENDINGKPSKLIGLVVDVTEMTELQNKINREKL
jgi:two-component system CheB/CheR fusion protein